MESLVKMKLKLQPKFEKTYRGKKVLLTGHTGFKGAWLLYWLNKLGAEVYGYALAPEQENALYYQINGDQLCQSAIADIRDKFTLTSVVREVQPDFVFHLAAQSLVRLSYDIPVETFEVNTIGTANILDAIRLLDKPCIGIMITTDKVYENRESNKPYKETNRLGGYDAYSASKACAELVVSSFRQSFFNTEIYHIHEKSIASARAGNVIGGGDWAKDRIIPDIIRALSKGEIIQVRNPHAIRPWQHVLDPLNGYLLLGAKMIQDPINYASSWNFGPLANDNLKVSELVDQALKIWGFGEYALPQLTDQPHESNLLMLDIDKSVQELSWKPKWKSEEAVKRTIEWYKNSLSNNSAVELIERDLQAYIELLDENN